MARPNTRTDVADARLDEWRAKLEAMEAKLRKSEAKTRAELEEAFTDARRKADAAQQEYDKLVKEGESAGEAMIERFRTSYDQMKAAVEAIAERMK